MSYVFMFTLNARNLFYFLKPCNHYIFSHYFAGKSKKDSFLYAKMQKTKVIIIGYCPSQVLSLLDFDGILIKSGVLIVV